MTELIKSKSWRKMFDYRWTIVMVMLFGSIINYLDRVNLSIANTTIAKEFGLDPIQMGLLLSAFMWSYSLANLLGIAEAPFFIIGGQVTQQYFSNDERGMASQIYLLYSMENMSSII